MADWVEVNLYRGGKWHVIKVDRQDEHLLYEHHWSIKGPGYLKRGMRVDGSYKSTYLHRVLMDCPEGMEVDHCNGDPSDNRRNNLRIVTKRENCRNVKTYNKWGVKGVKKKLGRNKYTVEIVDLDGKERYHGSFDSLDEAQAKAREVYIARDAQYHRE